MTINRRLAILPIKRRLISQVPGEKPTALIKRTFIARSEAALREADFHRVYEIHE